MPTHIKFILSLLVLVVGAVFFHFESVYGQVHVATAGAGLSTFMIIAMWIFPEAG